MLSYGEFYKIIGNKSVEIQRFVAYRGSLSLTNILLEYNYRYIKSNFLDKLLHNYDVNDYSKELLAFNIIYKHFTENFKNK